MDSRAADMHVVLLGDSTIDNVCWTGHPREVPEHLKALLPGAHVTNFAADGFTSSDLLHGAVPCISAGKRREIGDAFPECADGIFRPLDLLASLKPPPTHAVISIGGNDVREILRSMGQLPAIIEGFHENYAAILEKVCASVPNVVLMFQYRPSFNMDGGGYGVYQAIDQMPGPGDPIAKINQLMQACYAAAPRGGGASVLAAAQQRRLAIVDLPRTFDIYDDELFCCQIEPSAKGGALIAELLSHAISKHDFSGPSKFYLRRNGKVRDELNDGGVKWNIPQDPTTKEEKYATLQEQGVEMAAYEKLLAMGFEPARVKEALKASRNDIEVAIGWLTESKLNRD